jgi:peptidyl-prolyl cis-trans isomerase C
MKKFMGIVFAALLTAASGAYAAAPAVVAKVNGKDVTQAEIDKAFAGMTMDQPGKKLSFASTPVDFQRAFVEKYIERMLIIDAAKKAGLANDPDVKQKLQEAEDFLVQQKFLGDLVAKEKSDAAVKKLYDEKLKAKDGKDEVHAMHILVKTEAEAKKIREEVTAKGGDFDKIAKAKSIEPGAKVSGGDLGYFTADQMAPEFSKAAFALKVGEISQPVQSPFGWHLIKLVDKRKKTVPSFAESKKALENELAGQIVEDEVQKLKAGADIQYFGNLVKAPVKAAPATKKVEAATPAEKTTPAAPPAAAKPTVQ